jgi:hypothetical protein
MRQHHYRTWLLASVCATSLLGCDEPPVATPAPAATETDTDDHAIIGGLPANSVNLNAVGVLGFKYSYGSGYSAFSPFCSGTLIGEQTVLTAKHCSEAARQADGKYTIAMFGIGPDGNNPQRLVEIVDTERAPGDYGGFVGFGRDVGTVHLAEKIASTEIKPMKTAALTDAMVGTSFAVLGYGVQDNSSTYGTRRVGTVRLGGLHGKIFEMMFGSFEAFKSWFLGNGYYTAKALPVSGTFVSPPPDGGAIAVDAGPIDALPPVTVDSGTPPDAYDWMDEYLHQIYDSTILLDGYEAYVGNAPGNAQPCFGDSGGPLLRLVNGELTIYGVTSGGISSPSLMCDYGAIYATFGPDVASFLNTSVTWQDPCAGVSRLGICEQDQSVRCTYPVEGKRRQVVVECALLGQICMIASDGEALCSYVGEDPLPPPPITRDGGVIIAVDAGTRPRPELTLDAVKATVDSLVQQANSFFLPAFARQAQ